MVQGYPLLHGQTCLVTGASRGIGAAITLAIARQGGNIVINYLNSYNEAGLIEQECRNMGVYALAIRADISSRDQVDYMFDRAEKELGTVSILINNAGISNRGLLTDITEEEWQRVMDINLKGPFLCSRRAIPAMIARRQGRIVNITSIWGLYGAACESVYAASKGGLIALTRSLASELGPSGICVNAIAPGPVLTDMLQDELDQKEMRMLVEEIPMGRLGTPEDIAQACLYMISPLNTFVNGQVLVLDGGWKV